MMFAPLLLLPPSPSASPSQTLASQATPPGLLANTSNGPGIPGLFASLLNLHAKATSKPAFPVLLPDRKTSTETPEPVKKELSDPFVHGTLVIENVYVVPPPPTPSVLTLMDVIQPVTSSENTIEPLPVNPLPAFPVMTTPAALQLSNLSPVSPTHSVNTIPASLPTPVPLPPADLGESMATFSQQEIRSSLKQALDMIDPSRSKRDFTDLVAQILEKTTSKTNDVGSQSTGYVDQPTPFPAPIHPAINPLGNTTRPDESNLPSVQAESGHLSGLSVVAGGIHTPMEVTDFRTETAKTIITESPPLPISTRPTFSHPVDVTNFDVEPVQVPFPEPSPLPILARSEINSQDYTTTMDSSGFPDKAKSVHLNGDRMGVRNVHIPVSQNEFGVDIARILPENMDVLPATAQPVPEPVPDYPTITDLDTLDADMFQSAPAEITPLPMLAHPEINQLADITSSDASSLSKGTKEPVYLSGRGDAIYTPVDIPDFGADLTQISLAEPTSLHHLPRPEFNRPADTADFAVKMPQTSVAESISQPLPTRPEINRLGEKIRSDDPGLPMDKAEPVSLNGRGEVAKLIDAPVSLNKLDVEKAQTLAVESNPFPFPAHQMSRQPSDTTILDESDLPDTVNPAPLNGHCEVSETIQTSAETTDFNVETVQTLSLESASLSIPARPEVNRPVFITTPDETNLPLAVVETTSLNERGEVVASTTVDFADFDAAVPQPSPANSDVLPTSAQPAHTHPTITALDPTIITNEPIPHPILIRLDDLSLSNTTTPNSSSLPMNPTLLHRLNDVAMPAAVDTQDFDMETVQTFPNKPTSFPTLTHPTINRPVYTITSDESRLPLATLEPTRLNGGDVAAVDVHASSDIPAFNVERVQTPPAESMPLPIQTHSTTNRPADTTMPDVSNLPEEVKPARLNSSDEVTETVHTHVSRNNLDSEMAQTLSANSGVLPRPAHKVFNHPETNDFNVDMVQIPPAEPVSLPTSARPIHTLVSQTHSNAEIAQISSTKDPFTSSKPAFKKEILPTDTPENIPPSRVDTFLRLPTVKEISAPQFVTQISQAAENLVKAKHTTLHLQLSPETLGQIDLQLTSGSDGTRVTLITHLSATGTLLTQHLDDLRASLAEVGVAVNGLVVQYQTSEGQFGWARAWYQPPAQPAPSAHSFSEKEALSEYDELSPHHDVSGLDYRI
ncbi:MAG: flagellar hook-length control protein FliK [Anaerolineales bacterium]|nr:flagellar hook-length control protein FliK [Anaerolineales bacterium]